MQKQTPLAIIKYDKHVKDGLSYKIEDLKKEPIKNNEDKNDH